MHTNDMDNDVTFETDGDETDVIYAGMLIGQIDKGRTAGRPSESWNKRLDRLAPGYTVRYGTPNAASVRPEKWFATLNEAEQWASAHAPRPMRINGDVKWVTPS